MAIKIGSNFTFQGKQPNFERDRFATKADMKAFPETSIDDGHLSYCMEDKNTYQFKSSNSVDATTGKWRLFKADVDLSAYATVDAVNIGLNKKIDIKGVKSNSTQENNKAIKILIIDIPDKINRTGRVDCTIINRYRNTFNITITINVTSTHDITEIVRENTYNRQNNIYYSIDKTTHKLVLYYSAPLAWDYTYTKITNIIDSLALTYTFHGTIIDALPEDAIRVININNGNKNRFYATPKDAAGDPTFRTIDVADLPDLSSKYATKAKAFTKDTVSTEPGQVVAGPPTTQGNLYLRKLIADDIPDLKSKYQALNSNGYQPNPLMINARVGADSNSGYKYLTALTYGLPDNIPYKESPDWYYATDGTLQDITTKIPKVTLDDAVSTTSDNGVKNSVITKYVDGKVTTINNNITDLHSSLESTQTDFVDLRNKVNAMPKTVFITQAAYNTLTTKDANTIYYING